jgi:hypothetical protein
VLLAALAAAAVVVGGPGAVLIVAVMFVVVLDAVIPLPSSTRSEADDRYRKLVRARHHDRRAERLDLLDETTGWVGRRALGVELIEIDSVTGTVEPLKAEEFDRAFRPDGAAPFRWKGIWLAHAHNASIPPVSVYRVGHHRISVARDRGLTTIEADIVELRQH